MAHPGWLSLSRIARHRVGYAGALLGKALGVIVGMGTGVDGLARIREWR